MTANVYANEVDRMQWDARLAGMDVRFERAMSGWWYAYDARTYDGAPDASVLAGTYGHGRTQEAALEDLVEKLEDR